jgi:hypothetical protein
MVNEVRSENEDFATLCKASFRYVQVTHHMTNWNSLPRGVERGLDALVQSIRPPMPSGELSSKLAALAADFGEKVCDVVRNHLVQCRVQVEQALLELDDKDADRAGNIVRRQLESKLGKKMEAGRRGQLLDEALQMVGAARSCNLMDADKDERSEPPAPVASTSAPHTVRSERKRPRVEDTPSPVQRGSTTASCRSTPQQSLQPGQGTPQREQRQEELRLDIAELMALDTSLSTENPTALSPSELVLTNTAPAAGTSTIVSLSTVDDTVDDDVPLAIDDILLPGSADIFPPSSASPSITVHGTASILPPSSPRDDVTVRGDADTNTVAGVMLPGTADVLPPSSGSPNVTVHGTANILPPSSPRYDVTVRDKNDTTVSVRPDCRVLILGDSNLRFLSGLPADYQVECFPGAKIFHITDVLNALQKPLSCQHVLLAVGINHRDQDYQKVTSPALTTCLQALRGTGCTGHFLGVSVQEKLAVDMKENVSRLNAAARSTFQQHFIQPLPSDKVSTKRDGIHYETYTVNLIKESIVSHFVSLN